jgi:hypothetical protein
MKVTTRSKVKRVTLSITCMKRLLAHPRYLTRASKLAWCKRGFSVGGVLSQISFSKEDKFMVSPCSCVSSSALHGFGSSVASKPFLNGMGISNSSVRSVS